MADRFVTIRRGRSTKPLFVSAVGWELENAAAAIAGMHGPYRIPTLLRLADRLARG
jgi:deoxyribonuclease V